MATDQLAIKILLIVVFAAFAIFLMMPSRGVRHIAVRRLAMAGLLVVTVLAVVFPGTVNSVAHLLGVGRGTDLLLYGLIVVSIGNSLITQRRHRTAERQITQLARKIALMDAARPAGAPPTRETRDLPDES